MSTQKVPVNEEERVLAVGRERQRLALAGAAVTTAEDDRLRLLLLYPIIEPSALHLHKELVMLGILFGKTLEAILQHLLPSPALAKQRGKRAVGKRLIQIAWLLEDFAAAYERLRLGLTDLGEKRGEDLMHYIGRRGAVHSAFGDLSRLTRQLGAKLADLKYLKLFDSEFYETLIDSYQGDEYVYLEFGDLLLAQLESIDFRLSVDQCSLIQDVYYRETASTSKLYTEPVKTTKGFDLASPEQAGALLSLVTAVEESIAESQKRLTRFIRKRFAIEDLFAVREG